MVIDNYQNFYFQLRVIFEKAIEIIEDFVQYSKKADNNTDIVKLKEFDNYLKFQEGNT